MLDQMHISASPPVSTPVAPVASKTLTLGHTAITVDDTTFVEAMEYGLITYCEADINQPTMTVQELIHLMLETFTECDEETDTLTPLTWRLGFLFGQMAGLLNPDLANAKYLHLGYLEALDQKCQQQYRYLPCMSDVPICIADRKFH